jgi:competence protein ComEA
VSTVPRTFARPDAPDAHAPYGSRSEQLGYPPPGPRIDVSGNAPKAVRGSKSTNGNRVDLDHATATEIEALPRVGPALAKRIVANRDSLGPFRSLANLRRVKGIGPATIELLSPLVTFGGRPDR